MTPMLPDSPASHRYAVIPDNVYKQILKHPLCSNFFLTEIGYRQNTAFAPNARDQMQDEFVLVYIVTGSGSYRFRKVNHKAEENDFFVFPAKSLPVIEVRDDNPWTIYWAFFSGLQAAKVARFLMGKDSTPKKAKPLVGRVAQFNDILHHLELMSNTENLVYANSRFYSFICSFKLKILSAKKHGKKDHVIHTIEYMRENIGRLISLEELANVAGLSVSHYCAVFKRKTSQTPIQLFTSMKIQRACQWLQNESQTIKTVSYNLGFFDQYHFSKVFKMTMGVSPRAFKKQTTE